MGPGRCFKMGGRLAGLFAKTAQNIFSKFAPIHKSYHLKKKPGPLLYVFLPSAVFHLEFILSLPAQTFSKSPLKLSCLLGYFLAVSFPIWRKIHIYVFIFIDKYRFFRGSVLQGCFLPVNPRTFSFPFWAPGEFHKSLKIFFCLRGPTMSCSFTNWQRSPWCKAV